jgi:UDP-glucose:glycoprotein glucosyltransferase
LGYFQLKASPGVWDLSLAPGPSSDLFSIQTAPLLLAAGHATRVLGAGGRRIALEPESLLPARALRVTMADFSGQNVLLLARKQPGKEAVSILDNDAQGGPAETEPDRAASVMGSVSKWWSSGSPSSTPEDDATVHVFSLASGHLYERFLKIMMQSVLEKTQRKVKFWLLKNFLSPAFIGALPALAKKLGFEYGLVQYQWPSWLHKQTDKQRIIWGYKILFLDVMFPLSVKRIIYIDADQVRG